MPHPVLPDVWASGAAYEPYVGRWSRLVAAELMTWLGAGPGRTWLDVGCGTGALTRTILESSPAQVIALDASHGFASFARATIDDPRAAFAVADARAIPCASGIADVTVSGLVLNFVPQPEAAVREMARVTRSGGTVAVYVWDYAAGMQMMRLFWDAAAALDPAAAALDEGRRFPICHPSALAELWREAGLSDIETRALDIPTRFASFDDFWNPFLGGQGPAPSYVAKLDAGARGRLRELLRGQFPSEGPIALTARAWALRGTRRVGR
jgi:SAM-dependent methyltransferase